MAGVMAKISIVCLVAQGLVQAFPTGAPVNTCANLYPSFHGPTTATGTPPYKIVISANSYQPKQTMKVTLTGVGGAQFKGFLLEGRINGSEETDAIGFFRNPPSTAKLLCDNPSGNGVTHTNNTIKSSVTFDWEAPNKTVGVIVFHYTVVRGGAPNTTVDAADYFMDVQSAPLPPVMESLVFKSDNTAEKVIPVERLDIDVEVVGDDELELWLLIHTWVK